MENQTTEVQPQSEQPTDVVQNTEATAEVNETVLTTEQPQVNFKDSIPEQYREEKSLENINSMDDLLKGYVHAQKLVGTNKIPVPNKHSTDEDWNEVFKNWVLQKIQKVINIILKIKNWIISKYLNLIKQHINQDYFLSKLKGLLNFIMR